MSSNGRNHEPFDSDVSGDFTCKFCGRTFKDIRTMIINTCIKTPIRGGCHSQAR
jgi:hypothetical protein